jgi:hypothetical protein
MAQGKAEDICGNYGGHRQDGGKCQRPAGWGRDADTGKCRRHYGMTDGGESHENNGNAEKHGMTSDGRKWFARHRDDVAEDVELMVEAWMDDAPFGWENTGNVSLLVDAAINECQVRRGDEYIQEEGVVVTEFKGVAEDGREIYEDTENPAFKAKSRLQRDTVRILEKLGILDDPETQKAESVETLAEIIDD